MAHGDRTEHETQLAAIREIAAERKQPVAVLVDLAGPKIRLGELPGDELICDTDDRIRFVREPEVEAPPVPPPTEEPESHGSAQGQELTTTYQRLVDELSVGDRVMLADGTVALEVEAVEPDYAQCRVVQPGRIRSRQGVNLPGVKLSVPALGPKDRDNAAWAAQRGVDFVGLSFVRRAEEIRELKQLLGDHSSDAQVVAKIEKPEALANLEAIVEASDAVMVARGDLGVEIDIAEVAVAQKRIIDECNRRRRPVIIATQMLDSMQHSPLPTRAEVTDVANAILDGADACMLSGETAIGEYPRQSVEMMHRIALATEPMYRRRPAAPPPDLSAANVNPITEATVYAASQMAQQLEARLIVVATASGATALALAKNRNFMPTVGVSKSEAVLRRMCLYWGVIPLADAPIEDSEALLEHVTAWAHRRGLLDDGDRLVLIAGTGLPVSRHNMIVVHQVERTA